MTLEALYRKLHQRRYFRTCALTTEEYLSVLEDFNKQRPNERIIMAERDGHVGPIFFGTVIYVGIG